MQTVTINNREYHIDSTRPASAYTALAAHYPNVTAFHIGIGKRGAVVDIAEFLDGRFIILN